MSEYGLVNNQLRSEAWPLLLNVDVKAQDRDFTNLGLYEETAWKSKNLSVNYPFG